MPYATRGLYGKPAPEEERFSEASWVQTDICDRRPWPFADGQFDFSVCAQTLEDVRDPVWVCSELARVSRAGYVETPSRLEEQAIGVHGDWAGWTHHRWLVDRSDGGLVFVHKPHMLAARPELCLTRAQWEDLRSRGASRKPLLGGLAPGPRAGVSRSRGAGRIPRERHRGPEAGGEAPALALAHPLGVTRINEERGFRRSSASRQPKLPVLASDNDADPGHFPRSPFVDSVAPGGLRHP